MAAHPLRVGEAMDMLEPHVEGWHLDVMDGHFVPNLTFGPDFLKAVVDHTKKIVDVHLMVEPAEPWLEWLPNGVTNVTFHPEATAHPYRMLQALRERGIKAGVALSPGTGLHVLEALAPVLDIVLILCVNPGWSGQSFIREMTQKIIDVHAWRADKLIALHIDGGINPQTADLCRQADAWVMGSALMGVPNPLQVLHDLRRGEP